MARSKEYEALYWSAFMFAMLILGINIYYNCHPLLHAMGLTLKPLDFTVNRLRMGGLFERNAVMKLTVALLVILSARRFAYSD